jgi:ABC-2 type transport system ATP-binding protein
LADNGYAIQATNLTKYYGKTLAVDHVDFEVRPGEVFGLLGPNGAGKTTTVRMLNTLLEPTEGAARINGYDVSRQPYQAKRQFGLVPEESNVYTEISTWDNLMFTAKLYRIARGERERRVEEQLELFELQEKREDKVFTLSKGMRQRLSLAMALIHQPPILFLDEPVLGLDVQSAQLIKERLRQLNDEGITILLTTHQIEMADQLCDRVAIIHHGQIVVTDSPERLKWAFEGKRSVEAALDPPAPAHYQALAALAGVTDSVKQGNKVRLYTADPSALLREVMDYAQAQDLRVLSLNTLGPSLEDVFLAITGQRLGPAAHKFEPAQCKNCPMHDECESKEEGSEQPPRRSGILRSACEH